MLVLIFHSGSLARLPSGELHVALAEKKMLLGCGVNVELIEFFPKRKLSSIFAKETHAAVSNIWCLEAYHFVTERIAAVKPDVVHFHGLFPYLSASALAAAFNSGRAVLQTLHNGRWLCLEGGFYREGNFCDDCINQSSWNGVLHGCKHGVAASMLLHVATLSARMNGRLFKWVDRFIAVSDFIREQHIRAGFPPDKIVVKNNAVDLSRFHVEPEMVRAGIAFVSSISTAKGVDVLKVIISDIRDVIHIVGDGPDLDRLQRYCDIAGYKHVKFWGKQPQERCFEIMASVVCTVVPSQCGEAFPLVATESMGLGTPVVGSDIGGLGPLLRSSHGGITVTPNNTQGFIDAVRQLLVQPSLVAKLGVAGQSFVAQNLNMERNSAELVAIYESVLKDK